MPIMNNLRPVLSSEIVFALTNRNLAWVEFSVEALAHATAYGEVRLDKKSFRDFIIASHALGFQKDKDTGVLCRKESWKGLTSKSVEDICQIVLLNPTLLTIVAAAANRPRRTFPKYKTAKQEKQEAAAAYYASQAAYGAQHPVPVPPPLPVVSVKRGRRTTQAWGF